MGKKIEPYKGIAAIYDEIRPSYPEQLIKDIISKTNLKKEDCLLEIGAGTGKATLQFAERGYKVHAVELGEDMAEILKVKCASYPGVTIDIVPFEQWKCSDGKKFDMIYSAQAFHWLDPDIKYKKCHDLLKDKGYLILFWYNPVNEKLQSAKEIDEKVDKVIEKYVSHYFCDNGKPERLAHDGVSKEDERKREIEMSGLFDLAEKIEYTQEVRNNADQYLKAMKSVPAFASILDGLDEKVIKRMNSEIEEVINDQGGYVGGLFKFSLYIAKKRADQFE